MRKHKEFGWEVAKLMKRSVEGRKKGGYDGTKRMDLKYKYKAMGMTLVKLLDHCKHHPQLVFFIFFLWDIIGFWMNEMKLRTIRVCNLCCFPHVFSGG